MRIVIAINLRPFQSNPANLVEAWSPHPSQRACIQLLRRVFECSLCSQEFTQNSSLIWHQRVQHDMGSTMSCKFIGSHALWITTSGSSFCSVVLLTKHCEQYHPGYNNDYEVNRYTLPKVHVSNNHNILHKYTGIQDHSFKTFEEFQAWKAAEEEEKNTCYVQKHKQSLSCSTKAMVISAL